MHVFSRLVQNSSTILRVYGKFTAKFILNKFKPTCKIKLISFLCFGYSLQSIVCTNSFVIAKCLSSSDVEYESDQLKEKPQHFLLSHIWQPHLFDIFLFVLAILAAVIAALVNIEIPLKLGKVVNVLSNLKSDDDNNFFDTLKFPSLDLLVCYGVQAISTSSYISLLSVMGERMAGSIKSRLFERIIVQDAEFFDSKRSGDLINRITADVQDFKSSFKQCVSQGLRGLITIIGSTISLVLVSKELTTVVIVAVPSLVLLGSIMGRVLRVLSKEAQAQNAKAAELANESIINIRTVKSFAMEDVEIEKFSIEVSYAGKLYSMLGVGIGIFQGLSNFAINGIVLGVLFSGGYMMSIGKLTPGDLMSFLVASQTIQKSLSTLSTLFGHLVKATASGARIREYLILGNCDTSPRLENLILKRKSTQSLIVDRKLSSMVEFRNVSFAYPTRSDQLVLKDFSLVIPEGSVVAICGESGAGKSTIASLLQRLYDPTSGDILIDGINIKNIDVSQLRSNILGLVSQQPQLFAKSIRENIRYGRIDATNEEIEQASKLALAHDFVVAFQQGYDTMVGERGGEAISGGQRQRIAIARAILKNPNVIILDEATSALDGKSEELVHTSLKNVMKNRTVLVIAHRLSTIRNADQIVVLKNGKIVEIGPHSVLMKNRSYYYEMVRKLEDKNK